MWFLGVVVYALLSKAFPGWRAIVPLVLAIGLVFAVRLYLRNHYSLEFSHPRFLVNGIDQQILSLHFRTLGKTILYFGLACFLLDVFLSRKEASLARRLAVPVSLYAISLAAVLLLPDAVYLPQYALPFSFVTMRLTSVCAVSAICLLGMMAPRIWQAFAFSAFAGVFFFLLWQETKPIAALEDHAGQLVSELPPNQRVIATIRTFSGSRFYFLNHLVDRACIQKCFSYSSYEPSSRQFRVHAMSGSSIVTASPFAADRMQLGTYVVQKEDLPVYEIDQCTPDLTKLCIRELKEGEVNGRLAPPLPK